jgi:signal peptidase II
VSVLSDRRVWLAAVVALVVLVVDQITKAVVDEAMSLHQTIPVLPFFSLTYVRNTGAAFGLFSGAPDGLRVPLFISVTVVALVLLVSFLRSLPADRWLLAGAVGGILGGAIGNFVCRLRYGEVIDFFHLHWGDFSWPMFNVADSAITVGAVIVLLTSVRAPAEAEGEGSTTSG